MYNKADLKKKKKILHFNSCVLYNNYGHLVTLYNYCLLCSGDEGVFSSCNLLKHTLGVPLPRFSAPSLRISLLIITEECKGGGFIKADDLLEEIVMGESLKLFLQTICPMFVLLLSFHSCLKYFEKEKDWLQFNL